MAGARAREAESSGATATVDPNEGMDPMEAKLAAFFSRFEARLEKTASDITTRVDERLQEIEARVEDAEAEARQREAVGLIPPRESGYPVGYPGAAPAAVAPQQPVYLEQPAQPPAMTLAQRQVAERKVAFIPKDDPLNPRSLSFDCWLNGNQIRIKRGEVGMLPLGFALELARGGHGHVIDMAAMSAIPVQVLPDESLRPSDGPPVENPNLPGVASSIPPELLRGLVN